jgi:Polyketide cyclase / dehydrase and lipid transport
MRRFLVRAGFVLVAIVALILVIAAFKPADYSVSRSIVIAAPPEKIDPLFNDFHNFASWSPWQSLDPNMTVGYSGAASGPGAMYTWDGNSKAGKGSMIILSSSKFQTKVAVNFVKPFANSFIATYDLTPQPDNGGTRVTWTMTGKENYMSKVMTVFVSMDKMVGSDFERGLASMKQVAEH